MWEQSPSAVHRAQLDEVVVLKQGDQDLRTPERHIRSRSKLSGMMPKRFFCYLAFVLAVGGLLLSQPASSKSGVKQQPFGTKDGRPITLYTLTNSHGVEIRAM